MYLNDKGTIRLSRDTERIVDIMDLASQNKTIELEDSMTINETFRITE